MIGEMYNQMITIAEDFNAWLQKEGDKVGLDPDTVQEIVKEFLK